MNIQEQMKWKQINLLKVSVENEICEYASIYGEYIATCDRLSAELQKLEKIED